MNIKESLKKTGLTLFRQLVLAVITGDILIWCSLQLLNFYTDHDKLIVVPNLAKKTLSQVQILLDEQQLHYEVISSTEYGPTYAPLIVISQSPEPNEWVKKNHKVYLTLDPSGYHKMTIPKMIQVTRRGAETTLQSVGLAIGTVTYVDDIGKDMVLKMQYQGKPVPPGDKLVKTSRIDLICGNGMEAGDSIPEEVPIKELMGN